MQDILCQVGVPAPPEAVPAPRDVGAGGLGASAGRYSSGLRLEFMSEENELLGLFVYSSFRIRELDRSGIMAWKLNFILIRKPCFKLVDPRGKVSVQAEGRGLPEWD